MATELPENVEFLPTAARELERIRRKDPKNFEHIVEDIARLGWGTLPPQGRKKLRSIAAMQFDCGRFRVVYGERGAGYAVIAIFPKSEQKRRLRNLY